MPGEFELIRRYFSAHDDGRWVELGIGDDCAILSAPQAVRLCLTTDTLNEGVHFFPAPDPQGLGYKALAVNLSDLAAMGARPWCFTLSLNLPESEDGFLKALSAGLFALAHEQGVALVGGNTARSGALSLTISAYGLLPERGALRRDRARVGDDIYVTGHLGGAAAYVAAGYGEYTAPQSSLAQLDKAFYYPPCRCAFAAQLLEQGLSCCAIDLSDGVQGDLGHILRQSGCGARVELDDLPFHPLLSELPVSEEQRLNWCVLGGGDYELLFTAPVTNREAVERLASGSGTPVRRIGEITKSGLALLKDGKICQLSGRPFEHFVGS